MNPYLNCIGFKNISNKNMQKIIEDVKNNPDDRNIFGINDKLFIEYTKMYTNGIGLIIRGILDKQQEFIVQECEPYVTGDINIKIYDYYLDNIDDGYAMVFDHEDSGNEIVIKLQDTVDYLKDSKFFSNYMHNDENSKDKNIKHNKLINMVGLSLKGTIVLPVLKEKEEEEFQRLEEKYYKELVYKFKTGDIKAAEMLNLYIEQTSESIRERLMTEDFLSVVEGYFLPLENNSIVYSILGTIKHVEYIENKISNEEVCKLILDVTGTELQIYINKQDLLGIPEEGRRFMGLCKLYGKIIKNLD